jgi:hypothetical protein
VTIDSDHEQETIEGRNGCSALHLSVTVKPMKAWVDAGLSLAFALAAMFVAVLLGTAALGNFIWFVPATLCVAAAGYAASRLWSLLFYSHLRR